MALIFIPESYRIVREAVEILRYNGLQAALEAYDATAVTLVAVNLTFVLLAVYFLSLVRRLREKHKQFEEKRLEGENTRK
jgi:hypothetical protein